MLLPDFRNWGKWAMWKLRSKGPVELIAVAGSYCHVAAMSKLEAVLAEDIILD